MRMKPPLVKNPSHFPSFAKEEKTLGRNTNDYRQEKYIHNHPANQPSHPSIHPVFPTVPGAHQGPEDGNCQEPWTGLDDKIYPALVRKI